MVYSTEIRWFFDTLAEVAVIEKWFNHQDQFFSGNWGRADIYLWQPGLINQSVKIREGKVEVKILLANRGLMPIDATNSGLANDWCKFSFELQESDEENKNLLQQFSQTEVSTKEELWVRVDKERLLVKFAVDPKQNSLAKIKPDAWSAEGCGVELTKIKVNQKAYYTFGLEAFSQTSKEKQNLKQVLNVIIPELGITNLQPEKSYSYPGFLAHVYAASA